MNMNMNMVLYVINSLTSGFGRSLESIVLALDMGFGVLLPGPLTFPRFGGKEL